MKDRLLEYEDYAKVVELLLGNVSGDKAILGSGGDVRLGDGSGKISYKGSVYGARQLFKEAAEIARDNVMLSRMVHDLSEETDAFREGLRRGRLELLGVITVNHLLTHLVIKALKPFGHDNNLVKEALRFTGIWHTTLLDVHDGKFRHFDEECQSYLRGIQEVLKRFVNNLTPEGEFYHADDDQRG